MNIINSETDNILKQSSNDWMKVLAKSELVVSLILPLQQTNLSKQIELISLGSTNEIKTTS